MFSTGAYTNCFLLKATCADISQDDDNDEVDEDDDDDDEEEDDDDAADDDDEGILQLLFCKSFTALSKTMFNRCIEGTL